MTEEEEDLALYGDDEEPNKVDDVKFEKGKASFEDILDSGRGRQWLWLRFADGRFEVHRLVCIVRPDGGLTSPFHL